MMRFEDIHRALRETVKRRSQEADAVYAERRRYPSLEELDVARAAVEDFDERTGPLVDDLVAAVRERQECEKCERTVRLDAELSVDVKTVGCGCDDRVVAALAALDEASGRG